MTKLLECIENNKKVNLGTLKAMIIDDHPLERMAVRNILEKHEITIISEARDGISALRKITTIQPDIVIIDEDIPIINGIDVVEKLRKKNFQNIIVVMSAKNDLVYGKRGADVGANAFVSKKNDIINLIHAIKAATNGYSYFPFSAGCFIGNITSEQARLQSLSTQEFKVFNLILNGEDNVQIAGSMNISNKTVSTYKSRLMSKLKCSNLIELYSLAKRNGVG
ncbi:acid-sensing system DNA-binding response regulator EvgA [Pantoea ananatis]|uniref:acid-sensing system DNA-binding response regulator EvgA n=1 Tax=Pantoea ananas TaxID=553 RepID=UPI00067AA0DE|nr:acid-sensing system DNA-binding response regulator EvgA [Pantoea ananatis]